MNDILILALVFLYQVAGNLVPWWAISSIADERGQLRRIYAYGYGCTGILGGFVLWAMAHQGICVSVWMAAQYLALLNVAAGLGALAPRGIRLLAEQRALREDLADYESAHSR
jgi:hypothetical protein